MRMEPKSLQCVCVVIELVMDVDRLRRPHATLCILPEGREGATRELMRATS